MRTHCKSQERIYAGNGLYGKTIHKLAISDLYCDVMKFSVYWGNLFGGYFPSLKPLGKKKV